MKTCSTYILIFIIGITISPNKTADIHNFIVLVCFSRKKTIEKCSKQFFNKNFVNDLVWDFL